VKSGSMGHIKKLLFFGLFVFPLLIFSQCLDGDCDSGQGSFKFKNGTYTGQFLASNLHGAGAFSSNKGYSYVGNWEHGLKSGEGKEIIKKHLTYEGVFANNLKHGEGTARFSDTKHMVNVVYYGEWSNGAICGKGEMTYDREVKYGRERVIEKNHLKGNFVNGIYQGRLISKYVDELPWEPFSLEMTDFQKFENLTIKERKKRKSPATIEGDIIFSCECVANTLIFDGHAILRKEHSWWSTKDIPTKTKTIVLNTMQREFDIIEWYATSLEVNLNKQKLPCSRESLGTAWSALNDIKKECLQLRKTYSSETSWNPIKGRQKNQKIQQKWDSKISKKLKSQQKNSLKIISRLRKKLNKQIDQACLKADPDINHSPIYREIIQKKEKVKKEKVKKEKVKKEKQSPIPQFPRSKQLE